MCVKIGSKLLRDPEANLNSNPHSNLLVGRVEIALQSLQHFRTRNMYSRSLQRRDSKSWCLFISDLTAGAARQGRLVDVDRVRIHVSVFVTSQEN